MPSTAVLAAAVVALVLAGCRESTGRLSAEGWASDIRAVVRNAQR
ncbi:MAG TPA: hypothetical protein VHJ69_01785 [Gemmatimonadales bacterium]|nr:hypothetical protein [Gemmatimonadales bacterium]